MPWFVYLIRLAPVGLIVVAAACKTMKVRAGVLWALAAFVATRG